MSISFCSLLYMHQLCISHHICLCWCVYFYPSSILCVHHCVCLCVGSPHSTCVDKDAPLNNVTGLMVSLEAPHTHNIQQYIAITLHEGSNEASVLTQRFVGSRRCARWGQIFKSHRKMLALILDGQLEQPALTPYKAYYKIWLYNPCPSRLCSFFGTMD